MAIFGYEGLESQLETLTKYEDVFLERSDTVELALETVVEDSIRISEGDLQAAFNVALAGIGEMDDEFVEAIVGFLRLVMLKDSDTLQLLKETGASEELRDFALLCALKYGGDLQRLNFRSRQGSNWWSSIEGEQVRATENIRHRHRLVIDQSREVEIDSVPYSDWVFVQHFLQQIMASYNLTGGFEGYNPSSDDPMELINKPVFNEVRGYVYAFEREFEQRDIELPSREELLEREEQAVEEDDG